ncbi:DUF6286 domain-containing protein [Corynebacterium aquilae]|uniref:DUF6286 domain-containing protein n=1 Tax=Corynebacterium aquilae TaxID=203263 RepID=UPI00095106DD|nr:DUF6286 domain-containing protein [Corynebacterium aquilae]
MTRDSGKHRLVDDEPVIDHTQDTTPAEHDDFASSAGENESLVEFHSVDEDIAMDQHPVESDAPVEVAPVVAEEQPVIVPPATPGVPALIEGAPAPKHPAASPVARYIAIIFGLLLGALGVLAIREYWLFTEHARGQSFLKPTLEAIPDWPAEPWLLPVGIVGVMLGVFLVYIAFRPRIKTHRRLGGAVNVWLRPVDVARMCTAHAEKVPGVLRAHTTASARSVIVHIQGDNTDPTLAGRVEQTLLPLVSELQKTPNLKIKFNRKGGEEQ